MIVVVSEFTDVIVPLPETTDQDPVPTAALFAPIVTTGLLIQTVWFGPATGIVGAGSTVIVTLDIEGAQEPLLIVHSNTFVPVPKFVIVVVADEADVIVPVPETSVHIPVPTTGTLPITVAVFAVIQIVWLGLAVAVVGAWSTCMLMVDVLEPQAPFAIVHCKIFKPDANAVTLLVSSVGVVTVPLPAITDHVPIPTRAVLPARTVVGELTHNVWLGPALEIVGISST